MLGVVGKLEGFEELRAALRSMPDHAAKRVIGQSLKHAGAPVESEAKQKAGRISPTIAGAITTQLKTFKKTVKVLKIGPAHGDRGAWRLKRSVNPITGEISVRFHKPEYTAHLVEYGTKAHAIRLPSLHITVQHPGTAPQPYLNPALEGNRAQAIGRFQDDAWARISRYARRVSGRKVRR